MTMGTPGPAKPHTVAAQQRRRAGLFRINAGSTHMLSLAAGTQQCTAHDHRDHPGAKTVFICLNPACSGRTWPDHVSMLKAHPAREILEKNADAHPYAMWSDDQLDPAAQKAADAAAKKAQDELDALLKQREKIYVPVEEIDKHIKRRDEASMKAVAAKKCIGLIAPPDPRVEE